MTCIYFLELTCIQSKIACMLIYRPNNYSKDKNVETGMDDPDVEVSGDVR